MDISKKYIESQRRAAKQQQKQPAVCLLCNLQLPDQSVETYLRHLESVHPNDYNNHFTGKAHNEKSLTFKDINETFGRTRVGNQNDDQDAPGSPATSLKRENSRSASPPKRHKPLHHTTSSPSGSRVQPDADPAFARRSTPKGTLWTPSESQHSKPRQFDRQDGTSSPWSRVKNTDTSVQSTSSPRLAKSGQLPPPGGGEPGGRSTHSASNPGGLLPAPAYLPGQDTTSVMIKQPETRPISQDQLVAEVKGIYAGLVMVEAKCIEVDNAQNAQTDPANNKLSAEQWQALIALHRTLLHEHHDFFLASQHPSAGPALKRLASKYAMPARMWRHGIHAFLELLRFRLPGSLEHMMTFIYLAYSMMALLCETVPAFEETWIECLGDLGRYRMAIEDEKPRDREIWTNVSKHWYSKAADKAPTTGRLYHHLAILARPQAIQQLFYYTKSLCVAIRFNSARDSIMTLLDPIMAHDSNQQSRLSTFELEFVRCHGILFSGKHKEKFEASSKEFLGLLDLHVHRTAKNFLEPGYHMASATCCSLIGYGNDSNPVYTSIKQLSLGDNSDTDHPMQDAEANAGEAHSGMPKMFREAVELSNGSHQILLRRIGDSNILPYLHVHLIFLYHLTFLPSSVEVNYILNGFPWKLLSVMLNTLAQSLEPDTAWAEIEELPKPENERPLPEDYALRGMLWVERYYPDTWFSQDTTDDDEKYMEFPSMVLMRKNRVLYLGRKIVAQSEGKWLRYDKGNARPFSVAPEYEVAYLPWSPSEVSGDETEKGGEILVEKTDDMVLE